MFYILATYIFLCHLLTYPVYPVALAFSAAFNRGSSSRYWCQDALYRWRLIAGTLSRCPFVLHAWLCKRAMLVKLDPKAFPLPDIRDLWGAAMDASAIILHDRKKGRRYISDDGQTQVYGLQLKAFRADIKANPDRHPPLAKGAEKLMG